MVVVNVSIVRLSQYIKFVSYRKPILPPFCVR